MPSGDAGTSESAEDLASDILNAMNQVWILANRTIPDHEKKASDWARQAIEMLKGLAPIPQLDEGWKQTVFAIKQCCIEAGNARQLYNTLENELFGIRGNLDKLEQCGSEVTQQYAKFIESSAAACKERQNIAARYKQVDDVWHALMEIRDADDALDD